MSDIKIWQQKIVQMFHDPFYKGFASIKGTGGHKEVGKRLFKAFTGLELKYAKPQPDWIATGADRPVLGSSETMWIRSWIHALVSHPLDGSVQIKGESGKAGIPKNHKDVESIEDKVKEVLNKYRVSNWEDEQELREAFLRLWRLVPQEIMKDNDAFWSLLPADSRTPDHSIWDHLRMTSACSFITPQNQRDEEQQPYFFTFSIGPVQTFIYQARTSRDLWTGSYLLADLAWAAMEPLMEEYGPDAVLYPSLYENPLCDQWLLKKGHRCFDILSCHTYSSMLPNKFTALLPKGVVKDMGDACRQRVIARWKYLSDKVFEYLEDKKVRFDRQKGIGDGPWKDIWKRQLSLQPKTMWIAVPWKVSTDDIRNALLQPWFSERIWGHYERARRVYQETDKVTKHRFLSAERGFDYALTHYKAQQVFNARKTVGGFPETRNEPGIKCSICGQREVLHNLVDNGDKRVWELRKRAGLFWSNLDPEGEGMESLCGICAFKRFLVEAGTDLNNRWRKDASDDDNRIPNVPFPSTSTMASLPFLIELVNVAHEVIDKVKDFIDRFDKTDLPKTLHLKSVPYLQDLVSTSSERESLEQFFKIDAEYLFPEVWQGKIRDVESKNDLDPGEKQRKIQNYQYAMKKGSCLIDSICQKKGCSRPSRHFALIRMDGDYMGRLLLGDPEIIQTTWEEVLHPLAVEKIKDPKGKIYSTGWVELLREKRLIGLSLHTFISRALAEFAYHIVPHVVEHEFPGKLIYAGGDDLLALAPKRDAIAIIQRLQDLFSSAYLEKIDQKISAIKNGALPASRVHPMLGQHSSLSAAVVIAHHKQPIRPLLNDLNHLLKVLAKEGLGRNSFIISRYSRNGQKEVFGGKWKEQKGQKEEIINALNTARDAFSEGIIPSTLPYKLQELLPVLEASDENIEMAKGLIRMRLAKSRTSMDEGGAADGKGGREPRKEKAVDALYLLWRCGMSLCEKRHADIEKSLDGILLARFLAGTEGESL